MIGDHDLPTRVASGEPEHSGGETFFYNQAPLQ